jgi:hypothetical protein
MSELMKTKLKNSIGRTGIIYLLNNFRFEFKIIACDEEFVEISDLKKGGIRIIKISEINEVTFDGY